MCGTALHCPFPSDFKTNVKNRWEIDEGSALRLQIHTLADAVDHLEVASQVTVRGADGRYYDFHEGENPLCRKCFMILLWETLYKKAKPIGKVLKLCADLVGTWTVTRSVPPSPEAYRGMPPLHFILAQKRLCNSGWQCFLRSTGLRPTTWATPRRFTGLPTSAVRVARVVVTFSVSLAERYKTYLIQPAADLQFADLDEYHPSIFSCVPCALGRTTIGRDSPGLITAARTPSRPCSALTTLTLHSLRTDVTRTRL